VFGLVPATRIYLAATDFVKKTTHVEDLEKFLAWLRNFLTGEEPRETEVRVRRRDGQPSKVRLR
jgi:PAS domain-containing protein